MSTLDRTVSLDIKDAYSSLKNSLAQKHYKIISQEPPRQITFSQGSLWGITPKTAKKTITINLESKGSQTQLFASSKLASDWKNITIIGCILAVALAGICGWIATDLTTFLATREPSFWSWIVTFEGNVSLKTVQSLINLASGLTVFLSIIVLFEIVIAGYANYKIIRVAQDTLNQL